MDYNFRVKKSERGTRLDNFLYQKMGNWSHKKIKLAVDKKRVFVNGKNVFISGWNLKPGDRVEFRPEKTDFPHAEEFSRYHYIDVIYEDQDILVANKSPHIDYDSFIVHVNAYMKRTHGKNYRPYLGQMHRLDKETSGILLFTKKKIANVLSEQFRDRSIRKYYLAVVCGRVEKDHDIIRHRLEKRKFSGGKKVGVAHGGRGMESSTEYWVKERYDTASLLRVRPATGRTHQIRVHMSETGHAILGDKLYGKQNEAFGMGRQALHAHQIEFVHPVKGKKLKFEAPIPKDMAGLIDSLRLGLPVRQKR